MHVAADVASAGSPSKLGRGVCRPQHPLYAKQQPVWCGPDVTSMPALFAQICSCTSVLRQHPLNMEPGLACSEPADRLQQLSSGHHTQLAQQVCLELDAHSKSLLYHSHVSPLCIPHIRSLPDCLRLRWCRSAFKDQLQMVVQPGNDGLCGTVPRSVQALNWTTDETFDAELINCAPSCHWLGRLWLHDAGPACKLHKSQSWHDGACWHMSGTSGCMARDGLVSRG